MSDHGNPAERADLFRQILEVLEGHPSTEVLPALLQALLTVIGVSSVDRPRAEAFIRSLPAELIPLLEAEWPNYRAHRAKAEAEQSGSKH